MKVDINKKYRTKCGYDVVIYAVYEEQEFAVHGAFYDGREWCPASWMLDGRFAAGSPADLDLVEVKPERVVWINEFGDGFFGYAHDNKEAADRSADINRIALHRVVLSEDTVWKETDQ